MDSSDRQTDRQKLPYAVTISSGIGQYYPVVAPDSTYWKGQIGK